MASLSLPVSLPPCGGFFQGNWYFRFVGTYIQVIVAMNDYACAPTEENLLRWRQAVDTCNYRNWLWKFSCYLYLIDGDGEYGE